MNNRWLYLKCRFNALRFRIWRKIKKKLHIPTKQEKKRYGIQLISQDKVQDIIAERIISGKPFMAGRIGGVEGNVCLFAAGMEMKMTRSIPNEWQKKAALNAGFFPSNDVNLLKFWKIMQKSFEQVDILGSMQINSEEYIIKSSPNKNVLLTDIRNLEPYYFCNPWTQALKGKRVLVIHPFAETITSQYKKREKLFPNEKYLPDFNLITLKAVQSIAGENTAYESWFDALDYMTEEAMKRDFDIAIIGCGAYGFPLAARIKEAGKQVIHLGGATQLLFGIWGARWDASEELCKLKNEYWVRPSKDETPTGAMKVESACYW